MQKVKRDKPEGSDENNPAACADLKLIIETYLNTCGSPSGSKSTEESSSSKFQLDFFLNLCKQKQADATFLIQLLEDLKKCVHLLDPTLFEASLINMIFFEIKWHTFHSTNKQLLNHLAEFLIDLNSAYTSLIYKQMTMLVKLFQLADQDQEQPPIDCVRMHKVCLRSYFLT